MARVSPRPCFLATQYGHSSIWQDSAFVILNTKIGPTMLYGDYALWPLDLSGIRFGISYRQIQSAVAVAEIKEALDRELTKLDI